MAGRTWVKNKKIKRAMNKLRAYPDKVDKVETLRLGGKTKVRGFRHTTTDVRVFDHSGGSYSTTKMKITSKGKKPVRIFIDDTTHGAKVHGPDKSSRNRTVLVLGGNIPKGAWIERHITEKKDPDGITRETMELGHIGTFETHGDNSWKRWKAVKDSLPLTSKRRKKSD